MDLLPPHIEELLSQTDWSRVEHAFDWATDVPGQLRMLRSPREEERSAALDELTNNIWHQDTVYSATAAASRVILALVREPDTPDKWRLLQMLHAHATGRGYQDAEKSPVWQATIERERRWVVAARQAVLEGFETYLEFVNSLAAPERLFAAFLVTTFPERITEGEQALLDRLAVEADSNVRASMLLLLAQSTVDNDRLLPLLHAGLQSKPPERIATAMSLLLRLRSEAPPVVVDIFLLSLLDGTPEWDASNRIECIDKVHWSDLIRQAGGVHQARAIAVLLERLQSTPAPMDGFWAYQVLHCSFELPADRRTLCSPVRLTSIQIQVLTAIFEQSALWDRSHQGVMANFCLPYTREMLAEFLKQARQPRADAQ